MSDVDLRIAGGEVIDPASGFHDIADVLIADGRIVEVGRNAGAGRTAGETIDATGLLVTPGLIDLHAHVYPGVADLSVEVDQTSLGRGVTTVADGGSAGANTFPGFRRYVVEPARARVLAFLHISAMGQVDTMLGESHDERFLDPERAARVADANRDVVVGFKVRISQPFTGDNGLLALDRALDAGRATDLPVMVHIGGTTFPLETALDRLRPGDIVTHAFTGWDPCLVRNGRVIPAAHDARARGVRFDIGHGGGSFTWQTADVALAEGFLPDSISTDLHRFNIAGPVFDLPTTMSKFLTFGLPVADVVGMATVAPARAVGRPELGTLAPGTEADVTLLRLEPGDIDLVDSWGVDRPAAGRLVPVGVVRAGRSLPIQPQVTVPPGGVAPAPG